MRQLDRYIAVTVGNMMVAAVLGLVSVLTIFTFIEQIEDVEGDYTMFQVVIFCLFSVPRIIYELIPFGALVGCLAGLGALASSSELVVMRAAGISTWRITWSAIIPVLLLAAVGVLVGEFVLPDLERTAHQNRMAAIGNQNKDAEIQGLWYREGKLYMHFDDVDDDGDVKGISQYEVDDAGNPVKTIFAKTGSFSDDEAGERYWMLEGVSITRVIPPDSADELPRTEVQHLPSYRWDSQIEPELLNMESLVQPERMSIAELSNKIEYMRQQGLSPTKFELGFWAKVFQPLATVGLVVVAIAFIFGPLRESGMGVRILIGLVIGFAFKFLQDLLAPASMVFGFHPVIAVLLPVVMCFAVGYVLIRRTT